MYEIIICIVCSQQQIYVASVNNIWRFMCTPVTMQIKQLLACKEFELALHLAVSRSFLCFLHYSTLHMYCMLMMIR